MMTRGEMAKKVKARQKSFLKKEMAEARQRRETLRGKRNG